MVKIYRFERRLSQIIIHFYELFFLHKIIIENFINSELNKSPLSRFTESIENLNLLYFLYLESIKSITRQTIIVDGGKNRHL